MIEVEIKKPLYDNYVYIRKETLDLAIRRGNQLLVKVPKGRAIINPTEWVKNGKRMEKVFRRPNEPMVLYGGYVPIEGDKKIIPPTQNKML